MPSRYKRHNFFKLRPNNEKKTGIKSIWQYLPSSLRQLVYTNICKTTRDTNVKPKNQVPFCSTDVLLCAYTFCSTLGVCPIEVAGDCTAIAAISKMAVRPNVI